MGKPLSRPDCLRQNPACLGKGEEEDGYIEDCYVPQRSIYDTMRINEQIDQGCKQPSKSTIDRGEICTLSSNGTLGTSNTCDAKAHEAKKLDERVIFDALKLSNDTLKSAPVPPRRRPNTDRKENVNRRSWKAFMPPNFPEFAERIEASLSEVSEAGTSTHSLHDKTEFSHLLPDSSKHSLCEQSGSVSSSSIPCRTPVLPPVVTSNQEQKVDSRYQHVQSFDYYNVNECENDPLLDQENTASLCTHTKTGHNFPSATWPRALKSFIKNSLSDGHHKTTDMALEECVIETLPLSPCLSDEVLDESSNVLIVPNLREKTESELRFEEDEQLILMEAEGQWEGSLDSLKDVILTQDTRQTLPGKNKEIVFTDSAGKSQGKAGIVSRLGSHTSFTSDNAISPMLISKEIHESSCSSSICAQQITRKHWSKLGSYSDSDSDSDQLFLELEEQCMTEGAEAYDPFQDSASEQDASGTNLISASGIAVPSNLHKITASDYLRSPEQGKVIDHSSLSDVVKLMDSTPMPTLSHALPDINRQSAVEDQAELAEQSRDTRKAEAELVPKTQGQPISIEESESINQNIQSVPNSEELESNASTSFLKEAVCIMPSLSPDLPIPVFGEMPYQQLTDNNDIQSICESVQRKDYLANIEPQHSGTHDKRNSVAVGDMTELDKDSHSPVCHMNSDIDKLSPGKTVSESREASFQTGDRVEADTCVKVSVEGEVSEICTLVSSTERCIQLSASDIAEKSCSNILLSSTFADEIRTGVSYERGGKSTVGTINTDSLQHGAVNISGNDILDVDNEIISTGIKTSTFPAGEPSTMAHNREQDLGTSEVLSNIGDKENLPLADNLTDIAHGPNDGRDMMAIEDAFQKSDQKENVKEMDSIVTRHAKDNLPSEDICSVAHESNTTDIRTVKAQELASSTFERDNTQDSSGCDILSDSENSRAEQLVSETDLSTSLSKYSIANSQDAVCDYSEHPKQVSDDFYCITMPLVLMTNCNPGVPHCTCTADSSTSTSDPVSKITLLKVNTLSDLSEQSFESHCKDISSAVQANVGELCQSPTQVELQSQLPSSLWKTESEFITEIPWVPASAEASMVPRTSITDNLLAQEKSEAYTALANINDISYNLNIGQVYPSSLMQENSTIVSSGMTHESNIVSPETTDHPISVSSQTIDSQTVYSDKTDDPNVSPETTDNPINMSSQTIDLQMMYSDKTDDPNIVSSDKADNLNIESFDTTADPYSVSSGTRDDPNIVSSDTTDDSFIYKEAFQKEQVDSLQVKLQQVNGLGQGLIQSADKNCDVHCLEHDTDELNAKWNTLNKKVAERLTQLQEALLHCGKFQDALEPLLSWLTDTEELIANQKPPSAEYKVVKAQIQEQKLLQRLLDDRRATVEMIQAEGVRIADGAEPADQDKINRQLEFLGQRWFSLLQKAQSRQKQLDDILVLAKQFHETTEPIFDWLSATEKKLANSEPIGTQTSKIQQQIGRHKSLEDDITVHETAVCQASKLGDSLSALCSQAEQDRLAQKLDFLQARYSEVQDLCNRKGVLLGQALSNARLFGEDEVEVLNWLSEVEDRLSSVCVKDYKLDALQKQHTDHLALSEEIINRKRNVDQAVKNGQALLKQTTGEEVLLIQEKLDGIKTRYAEITASSGKALRTLEQALQLAGKFQTTHDELTSWLRQVEDELTQSSGQSPAGDQIPQFQQRQKELKKEAMEYRIVLDTINEVGSALLELVPWRAREGLDKLVSDANEQYRSVSTTVGQRVDQIDAAIQRSQQYEQAADAELAWVAETKRKLLALGPICLEQDQTTAQLQVQKAFSVDIIRHKDSIDELLNTQEEILGTCGDGQKASLQEKTEILLQQYEEVSHLNSERYARLEKAQGLVGQFWETYEELNPWIEEMQTLISQLPPPAVDHDTLRQQQEDVRQLRESVSEHKPHIDKLLKIGPLLCELNPEEGAAVREKYSSAEKMYLGIKEDVRKIAMALDDAVAQASQFHDKIGPMLETLENLASRLRIPPLIPAEVEKIRDCISENKNALMELEKLQPSFEALKHRGEELIKRSQGADTDPAAKEIQDKLDQLVFFWEDIKARADEREMKFLDVLELAEKFWLDMGSLLTTIKDTHDIVHDLESPGIDPSMIKQQIEAADSIKEETDGLHEELEFIRILGADLIFACGETEKPEVKKSIDEMNNAWENLKKTWSERLEKLRDAMSNSVQYQDTLQAMFDWLDNAVIKLCDMPPVGTDIDTVKDQLNAMKEFKVEVYQQQIEMEKLNHQGELMLKKAIDDTDRDIIQGPLTELKHLWENLGEKIARRQHKLEGALLALGQFQHALEEVMSWLVHTDELLDAQKPISGDPKVIEVELAKHHVLKNDVLAHESTVQTVNKAGNELLESSARDDANSLRTRLETLNQLWEAVLLKTEEREQQLDLALQQAQGFTGEIEDFLQWQSRIESQLSSAKATGGLPETAREQLQAHMELHAELKAKEDIYKQLLDKGHLMLLSRDDAVGSITEQNVALLKRKWESIANKVEERKVKLEEALALATDFQNSLQEFINWLTQAEQSLNIAPSPSLILDTVLFQIDEHKIFVNEVNLHREQIIELDKTGNQLKFLSQKQDVVLIKNLLLSVLSRWEKVVQRSVDRGRSLDDSRKRAKQFHEAWKKLVDWLEEAENHLDSDMEISNDPDKIKLQLTKHKEFQKTLGSKQPVYDTTVRTGRALKEKALLSDDVQKLDHLLGEVRDKWDTVCGKSVERQHKLEEALLFSGQFMDALQALVDWLYKVEPQLAEDQPVHGDLDLVMNLMDAHKVFQKELGKRTSSVHALKRSARELLESSREDTTWVKVQLQELSTRWDTVCKLSVSKQTRLEQALKQAEEFRSTVHMLLEWLSEAEQTLRFRGALPDDAESLQSLIDVHKEFMKKVEEKHVDVNTAVSMGEGILTVCHPDCITTIKHWITIIRARFEEVLTWGNQHQQRLQAALSELLANSDLLDELLSWIQWAETTLIQRDQEPMPQNIEQVKALIGEHQAFMEEMTQKQPDVDKVTKTYKRKTTDGHGSFNDKTRSRKPAAQTSPPALQLLSQSETKNPRINQLSARWQQVWLLALERQRKLNDALDRLEELKEFANFDFDIWRKKYMRWMNHKKSRVMDFFRRIDKDQDGKITRQEFIDGILASKFPTTKLEMTAVADIFDRDGDGYIDYYEFVAALHPNKDAYRPTTDADKIEDEVTRQVAQCKCAKRFQVEQIGENKYRFFLGNQFGDSQQLRLVRILRSTVMVRVGGGWMALDEFLVKNDPCRARGRTNLELREKFILPEGVSQGMTPFRSRGRRSKPSSRTASPTRSSSSASQSNHSCASVPSSPATPASGSKTPQQPSRCYEKPWLVNSKAGTPFKGSEFSDFHIPSCEVTPAQSSKMKKAAIHTSRSSLTGDTSTPSGAKSGRADPKKSTSRAGSRTGSRASSRRGSDASDFDLLETQSACSDTSESSRRGLSKPSKIPTISKKTASTPKTTGSKR